MFAGAGVPPKAAHGKSIRERDKKRQRKEKDKLRQRKNRDDKKKKEAGTSDMTGKPLHGEYPLKVLHIVHFCRCLGIVLVALLLLRVVLPQND